MARSMTAYRMIGWQQKPEFREVPVPEPAAGEVRVKVGGNGLCHSDIGMMHMPQVPGWEMPFTLGHEIAGWVDAVGAGVVGMKEGDAVAVVAPNSDGTCPFCRDGQDNACIAGGYGRGFGRDGGLAPYVLAKGNRELIPLKKLSPIDAGVLTDAGSTSYHAVKRVLPKLNPESTAVVLGVGGLGSFAVQFLKAMSTARIIAVDMNPARLAYAKELGADLTLAGVGDATASEILDLTEGYGAQAVLDFVGIDASIAAGLQATRRTGSYALVGAGGGGYRQPWFFGLPRNGDVFTFQASDISDCREVLALAESGKIRVEVERFPFEKVAEAYEKMDSGKLRGRAVVLPPAV